MLLGGGVVTTWLVMTRSARRVPALEDLPAGAGPYPLPPAHCEFDPSLVRVSVGLDPDNINVVSHFERRDDAVRAMLAFADKEEERLAVRTLGRGKALRRIAEVGRVFAPNRTRGQRLCSLEAVSADLHRLGRQALESASRLANVNFDDSVEEAARGRILCDIAGRMKDLTFRAELLDSYPKVGDLLAILQARADELKHHLATAARPGFHNMRATRGEEAAYLEAMSRLRQLDGTVA
jgi:hypothetical protein